MAAYYNEFDPFAAAWLRELIKAGMIPEGEVDERDIREVQPDDLRGFTQCHFFAGIGGWAYALRLAGWPDERPVWTGSPPCQPFSVAGKRLGKQDERHLAPVWLDLVRAVRPPVLFGEQVAAAVTKDTWLDDLLDALEEAGYSTGAAVTPACGVGAPHIRQRLWFTAERLDDSYSTGLEGPSWDCDCEEGRPEPGGPAIGAGGNGRLADGNSQRFDGEQVLLQQGGQDESSIEVAGSSGSDIDQGGAHENNGFWTDCDWLYCRDGKWRPVKPNSFPLDDGIPNRVGLLRGAGNAIVPQVASEVIRAFLEGLQTNG